MSSQDVTNQVTNAVNQTNQNRGGIIMNNANQPQLPLQETVLTKQVFNPNTGQSYVADSMGRRVFPRRDMTGTQLVRINSMRQQIGLPYLNEHNVKSMSIDSASLMIDDLQKIIARYRAYEDTIYAYQQTPEAVAQTAMERQANTVRNMK